MSTFKRHAERALSQHLRSGIRRVVLRGVPKTALPADIRRLCASVKVENVANIALEYERFMPTGSAWLTLNNTEHVRQAVRNLNGTMIAGHTIIANPAEDPLDGVLYHRARGLKGRQEAENRGLTGDGPSGGLTQSGKNVVLYGLPGRMSGEAVGYYLKGYKIAGATKTSKPITKVEVPDETKGHTLTSRFLVRLESQAEAYRLVRKLHETYYEPEVFDQRYRVRARVIH